jgi:micrococcal nuclease
MKVQPGFVDSVIDVSPKKRAQDMNQRPWTCRNRIRHLNDTHATQTPVTRDGLSPRVKKTAYLLMGFICLFILVTRVHTLAMDGYDVKRVVDGDTLLLENNRFVRYIGINAPELGHGDKIPEPFGIEAKKHHIRLVGNRNQVYLDHDQETRDHYGRELAYVYTPEKTFINQMMLVQGWAYYLYKPPNLRYHHLFLKAQRHAMQAQLGIWREWKVQGPGLVANKRSRRFHRQDCPYGTQTSARNSIFFPGLWEAFWEGYAPCKRCFPRGPFVARAD